jgi:acetolactate synthase-1/2/3 large subunit
MRHRRHHAADRQAQLPGQGRARPGLTLKKAFHIARTGRPGPVVVDIPKDVSLNTAPFSYPAPVEMRSYNPVTKGHGGQIRKAISLLLAPSAPTSNRRRSHPRQASAELRVLVDLLGFPCTSP